LASSPGRRWWFWRKKTTIEPHHTPTALIVEGPYRLSRNPIYLALLALLAGYVLRLGSLGPCSCPLPITSS
jgi:protein-S-isoprenylcysteine O-methyltransferase Ste14